MDAMEGCDDPPAGARAGEEAAAGGGEFGASQLPRPTSRLLRPTLGLLALVAIVQWVPQWGEWWWSALITPFTPHLAVLAGALFVALLALREWELSVLAIGLCMAQAWPVWEAASAPDLTQAEALEWRARQAAEQRQLKQPLPPLGDLRQAPESCRLLLANVNTANQGWERLLDLVQAEQPDVIALLEVSDAWMEGLAPLLATHPLRAAEPRGDNFGIALWSRIEPTTAAVIQSTNPSIFSRETPMIRARLPLAGGPLSLLVGHAPPPIGQGLTGRRNIQVMGLGAMASLDHDRTVLAGDFNMTPWCPLLRGLLGDPHQLHDARRTSGAGLLTTWPAALPSALRIPIDHILHDASVTCTSLRLGPPIGSDHLPLIADLR